MTKKSNTGAELMFIEFMTSNVGFEGCKKATENTAKLLPKNCYINELTKGWDCFEFKDGSRILFDSSTSKLKILPEFKIKEVRPFPIRHIESTFWRRTCIILGFIPVFLIGAFVDLTRAVCFLVYSQWLSLLNLIHSGLTFWDEHEPVTYQSTDEFNQSVQKNVDSSLKEARALGRKDAEGLKDGSK